MLARWKRREDFAAARNTEEAGSLTIVATALIEPAAAWTNNFPGIQGTGGSKWCSIARSAIDAFISCRHFLSGTRRGTSLATMGAGENQSDPSRPRHKPESNSTSADVREEIPTNTQMLKESQAKRPMEGGLRDVPACLSLRGLAGARPSNREKRRRTGTRLGTSPAGRSTTPSIARAVVQMARANHG